MLTFSYIPELRASLQQARQTQQRIAFVPTMGNLHAGHLELVRIAKTLADIVVVSIFVNPLQFGPTEDFAAYPRTLDADTLALQQVGTDILFTPHHRELYPDEQTIRVNCGEQQSQLEGQFRPGHFDGVGTVVLKLFNIVQPNIACFGKKDYQQLSIIRTMVKQLNVDIQLVGVDTIRAADGLALSSRNGYLSPTERQQAPMLYHVLHAIYEKLKTENKPQYSQLEENARQQLEKTGWIVQYIKICYQHNLMPPEKITTAPLVIVAAAYLGKTRLIDNLEYFPG